MSEAALIRAFDAAFFSAWADLAGGLDATYTAPNGVASVVQVLIDTGLAQFGEDFAPVSFYTTYATFRREQIEPQAGATRLVDATTYVLAQRVASSDQSLSRWAVQPQ